MLCSNCGTKLKSSDTKCPRCARVVHFIDPIPKPHLNLNVEKIKFAEKEEVVAKPRKDIPAQVWLTILVVIALGLTAGIYLLVTSNRDLTPKDPVVVPPVEEKPKPEVKPDPTVITIGEYELKKQDGIEYKVNDNLINYQLSTGENIIISIDNTAVTNEEEALRYFNEKLLPDNVVAYAFKNLEYNGKQMYFYNIITNNTKESYIIRTMNGALVAASLKQEGRFARNPIPDINNLPEDFKKLYDFMISTNKKGNN